MATPKEACDACDGAGTVPCPDCQGKGAGEGKGTVYEDGEEKDVYGVCETCDGSGDVECSMCGGEG